VRLPLEELRGRDVLLHDTLSGVSYERSGDELLAVGLYLDVAGWGHHAFEVSPLS
jgi:hypothetical protein